MLRLAAERDRLRVVADQRGCPTATVDIAEAILAVDAALARGEPHAGPFHFAGAGATSWHSFAARRPANSALNADRFAAAFGTRAKPWRERVDEVVAALLVAPGSATPANTSP